MVEPATIIQAGFSSHPRAYSMIAHRCQGATIASHVIVHVSDAFCPGLLYVMLSRVTNRRFLSIVTPLTLAEFTPAAMSHWAQRLCYAWEHHSRHSSRGELS